MIRWLKENWGAWLPFVILLVLVGLVLAYTLWSWRQTNAI